MQDCLKRVSTKLELDLHPSRLGDVQAGVQELLDEMLIRYDDRLDGVVLATGRPRITTHKAPVQPYFPLCRLHVNVSLALFKPQPGDLLTGRVIQVGPDFIGLLVMGVINASIAKAEMRSDWTWHKESREWRSSKHPSHVIAVQSHVRFHVHSIQKAQAFFGVVGQMHSKKCGEVGYLASHAGKSDATKTPVANGSAHPKEKGSKQKAALQSSAKDKDKAGGPQHVEPSGKASKSDKKRQKSEQQADAGDGGKSGSKSEHKAKKQKVQHDGDGAPKSHQAADSSQVATHSKKGKDDSTKDKGSSKKDKSESKKDKQKNGQSMHKSKG